MKIGLINNDDLLEINELLKSFCQKIEFVDVYSYQGQDYDIDIIILNDKCDLNVLKKIVKHLKKTGTLIVNSDLLKISLEDIGVTNNDINIINYGFNNKADVTTSSIIDNTLIQFCISKNLKSISNNTLYQQEFSVKVKEKNIYNALVLITTALAVDVEIGEIKTLL